MPTIKERTLALSQRVFSTLTLGGRGTATGASGISALQRAVKEAIEQTAEERNDLQKLRDFYTGAQIKGTGLRANELYIPTWPDEDDTEKGVRAQRMEELAYNRIREGVNTHADALYAWGRNETVARTIRWPAGATATEAERRELERFIIDRYGPTNALSNFMWDVAATFGAERRAVVMLMWMDGSRRRLKKFTSTDRKQHRESGVVWLEKLDNLQTIVLPHPDQGRTTGAIIRWYRQSGSLSDSLSGLTAVPWHKGTITEIITDNVWVRWDGNQHVEHAWGSENRYGDVRTQFVVAHNAGYVADHEDAMGSQILLLEHDYGASEIGRNHAFPETLYAGFEPPTKMVNGQEVLDRGPNVAYIATETDAMIHKVGIPGAMADLGLQESALHSRLNEAMGMSTMDRGSGADLGQLRSAPALAKISAKAERRRRRKILAATEFENDLFAAVVEQFTYHSMTESERTRFRKAQLVVAFPDDAFTSDAFTDTQKDAMEVSAGIASQRDKLRDRYPDLSEEELDEKLEEIQEEAKQREEAAAEARQPDPTPASRSQVQPANG